MEQRPGWMTCVRAGIRDAWRQRGLVILVWALFFAAALLGVVPAWRWWNATLSLAPEGDRLLDSLNAPLLRELSHYDRSPTWVIAFAPFSAFLLAMFVMNPLVAGGILSAFSGAALRDEPRATGSWRRFLAAGARHYWLFLRLLLIAIPLGVLLGLVFLLALPLPFARYFGQRHLEEPYLFMTALFPVALACAFWLTSIVLDIARVLALRVGEQRAWRALIGGLRFLLYNPVATLALGVAFTLMTALTFGIYFFVSSSFTPKSWLAILLAIVWQQVLSLTRTGLRISMLAAECQLVAWREPPSRDPESLASADQEIDGKLTSMSAPPDVPLPASIDPP